MSSLYIAGRALDALIAEKVMGWQRISSRLWHDQQGSEHYIDGEEYPRQPAWRPSEDTGAAWQVFQRIVQMGADDVAICYFSSLDENIAAGWVCVVEGCNFAREVQLPFGREDYSDTAPLAICRAALEWAEQCQRSI